MCRRAAEGGRLAAAEGGRLAKGQPMHGRTAQPVLHGLGAERLVSYQQHHL